MEIYYLKKEKFLNSINRESLEKFSDGRVYASDEKYLEHLCGLFLVRFAAKTVYGLEDTQIELQGKKPCFKCSELKFSISHSKDIVLAAFCNGNIGVDVEYMFPRNYKKIMVRYGLKNDNPDMEGFYRFWTEHEARIKFGQDGILVFSDVLESEYMLSCVSKVQDNHKTSIKELVFNARGLDLLKEFEQPLNLIFSNRC